MLNRKSFSLQVYLALATHGFRSKWEELKVCVMAWTSNGEFMNK